MSVNITANEKAKNEYEIPVTWSVYDKVKVQADSLEEAYEYLKLHLDEIPLGEDADYVDGSYEISASKEDCVFYQWRNDIVCTEFMCKDLSIYVDSMLFDSVGGKGDGETIAEATFVYKEKLLKVYLEVRGDVNISYNGERYDTPSEFPKELKERIRELPNNWDITHEAWDGDLEIVVNNNNWFEYIWETDGEIYEADLSIATPQEILEDMTSIARQYFGLK